MNCKGCGQPAINLTRGGDPICPDCVDEYGDDCPSRIAHEAPMKPPMTTPTQQDIEAATSILLGPKVGGGDGNTYVVRTPTHEELAQAFMRHRLAAEQAQRDRDARIADYYADMSAGSEDPVTCSARETASAIAAAIRGDEA